MSQFVCRLERENQDQGSVKEELKRKKIVVQLELEFFLTDLMLWMQGKNVFIKEDCMILNFGLVFFLQLTKHSFQ